MAIIDKKFGIIHDNANVFATGADVSSTDVIDTVSAFSDIGEGLPIMIKMWITTAVTGGTSIQGVLVDCDTVGGSYVDKILGPVVLVAAALAGKVLLEVAVPPKVMQRYVKVMWRNVGANGAGKGTAMFKAGR
jgi:hypothetical protein